MKEYMIELTEDEVSSLYYTIILTDISDSTPYSMMLSSIAYIVDVYFPECRDDILANVYDELLTDEVFQCKYRLP